ncbi:MAG: hypothetical protein V4582_22115 [Pseudomonadota bacterium]
MALNFDVVINTNDDSVDMKSGLDTLQGVSDATRYIAETLLGDRVPERQTHKAKVRTKMKQSFRGSYGQKFSVEVYDEKLEGRLRKMGHGAFAELVAYFLKDSIYEDHAELSPKAQAVIEEMGELHDELVQRLRSSALANIHEVTTKFGHEVKVRFRKSREEQIVLAQFDSDTAHVLDAAQSSELVRLVAGITRLNTHTGNGRLQVVGENETVAFGFGGRYKGLELIEKRKFSENLHSNNGKPREHWVTLEISAYPIRLRDGKIIKYIIG